MVGVWKEPPFRREEAPTILGGGFLLTTSHIMCWRFDVKASKRFLIAGAGGRRYGWRKLRLEDQRDVDRKPKTVKPSGRYPQMQST